MKIRSLGSRFFVWALGLALYLAAGTANAAVLPLTMEQMMALADEVVVVRVNEEESQFSGMGQITTTSKMKVVDTIKGKRAAGAPLEMTYLGGKVGTLIMEAPEVPRLKAGEEAILFLSRPIDRLPAADRANFNMDSPVVQSYQIVGGFQGKINIFNRGDDGQRLRDSGPIPSDAKVARGKSLNKEKFRASELTYASVVGSLKNLAKAQDTRQRQRGLSDKITGIRGDFAVPERSSDPVIRAFDPLPDMAYMNDQELKALKAELKKQQAGSSKSDNQRQDETKKTD